MTINDLKPMMKFISKGEEGKVYEIVKVTPKKVTLKTDSGEMVLKTESVLRSIERFI